MWKKYPETGHFYSNSKYFTPINKLKSTSWVRYCDTWKLYELQISIPINEVLLEHNHIYLYIVYGCFGATRAEVNSYKRNHMAQKA